MARIMMLVIMLVYPLAFVILTGNSSMTDVCVILRLKGSMNRRVLTCSISDRLTYNDKLDTLAFQTQKSDVLSTLGKFWLTNC